MSEIVTEDELRTWLIFQREAKGWTVTQASRVLNCARSTLASLEDGKTSLSSSNLLNDYVKLFGKKATFSIQLEDLK